MREMIIKRCPFCGENVEIAKEDFQVSAFSDTRALKTVCHCSGCGMEFHYTHNFIVQHSLFGIATKNKNPSFEEVFNTRKPIENMLKQLKERHKQHEEHMQKLLDEDNLIHAMEESAMKTENEISIEIVAGVSYYKDVMEE